jgi:hypothetical protein
LIRWQIQHFIALDRGAEEATGFVRYRPTFTPDLVDTPLAVPAKLNERKAVLVAWIGRIADVIAATHVFGLGVGGGLLPKNPFMFGPSGRPG